MLAIIVLSTDVFAFPCMGFCACYNHREMFLLCVPTVHFGVLSNGTSSAMLCKSYNGDIPVRFRHLKHIIIVGQYIMFRTTKPRILQPE